MPRAYTHLGRASLRIYDLDGLISVKVPLGRTSSGYDEIVPRPRRDLSTSEKRHLHSLEGRMTRLEAELQAMRREWAELVEEAGQAAVARELGVSRQAVADRLRRIRANREERSGRRKSARDPFAFSRGRVYVRLRYRSGASRFSHQRSEPT